ncbi:MAG TPA: hypothetical protein VFG34_01055 [Sphingopyxis sp.]|nr:hypothetical protein [Sphingopyxis sp.]
MTTLHRITQANVGRAIKAVQAQGLKVIKTEIAPDGTIRLTHSEALAGQDNWADWKSHRHEN